MRTTDSLTSPSRARSVATALRTRPVALGTTAVLAVGLALGAVGTATAQPSHSSSTKLAAATSTSKVVSANRIHTPSFEYHVTPWVGTKITRGIHPAPDGKWVAKVTAVGGRAAIDDWPGEAKHTIKGWTYTASMVFRTAGWSNWNKNITLVIREHHPDGRWVASHTVSTPLWWHYKSLTVSMNAVNSGDFIDMYAYQSGIASGSAFFADKARLVFSHAAYPKPPVDPGPPPSGGASSTLGLLAYATGQPTALGNTSRYAYVVVQENQFAHIAEIKRMNPNTKVLAYMQAGNTHYYSSCANTTSPHLYGDAYGVSYCWANRYHPDWFLKDRSGNRLHTIDYSFLMPMDVGNSTFANTWAAGTYANLKRDGFDGVWMDDVNIDPGHGLNGRFAKYTDAQYGAGTTKWASIVGDYMRSRGMIAIANVGLEPWVSYMLTDVLAMGKHLTAVNREHYVRYGDICGAFGERFNNTANNGTPPLSSFMDETNRLQAQGTRITGVDYGYSHSTSDDLTAMTYGRALFLLSWNGTAGSAYFFRKCGVNDTAAPQWTADLGKPTSSVVTASNGIMTRKFARGMVVLNPNRSGSSARVSVPAGLHTVSGATTDGGVYVAPQTAAILSS